MAFRGEKIKIPKRGKFYCTHPSDNGNGSCPFNVAFSFVHGALAILDGPGPDKTEYNTNFCGNGTAFPDKFFTLKDRIPPLHKARIGKLNEVFKKVTLRRRSRGYKYK